MPKIIQDESGEDIEVFTAEELEAQKTAALEEFKTKNPDKTDELTKAQEELEKLKGKDMNFSNLREQKEAAEKKVQEILAGVDEKVGAVKKEILEGVMKDHYSETLKGLAGEDAELQKQIEAQYNRLTDPAATKEEVSKKLRDAWVLATKVDDPGALSTSVISSGGVSRFPTQGGEKKFSPEEKAMAQKLAEAGGLGKLDDKYFQ